MELQNCLPEDTHLQRYSFNKGTIELTGLSAKSSDLLSRLSASKYFMNVKFKSSIDKDRETGLERFSIELSLKK